MNRLRNLLRALLDGIGFENEDTRFRDVDDLAEVRRRKEVNAEQDRLARLRHTIQHGT